jgi:sensor histidine kinase YesM
MMMKEQYETKFIFKYWSNIKNDFIDFIYVIIICTALSFVVTIIGPIKNFLINFVVSQSFGITVTSIVFWSLLIFKPRTWELLLFIVVIDVCCAVLIGLQICIFILQYFFDIVLDLQANGLGLQMIIGGILFSFFGVYFFMTKMRLKYRGQMIDREKTKRTDMEKENLSANLKVLQAQIEPHFLFNTLSNILSLIDTKPETGKSMLLDLTKYLRTSLSRTLPEKTTLTQEISMVKAYLDIQKIRMDERLNYKIDVPDDLMQHSFPPMLLQPLVENAVKHGLEPKVEGGEIVIRATQENNILKIEVADTGLGFSDLDKPGFGIANVRERIGLLFGEKGRLIIEENKPHGVRAAIEMPIDEL